MNQESVNNNQQTEFDSILEESLSNSKLKEGTIVKGTVVEIEDETVIIDVRGKIEGRVPKREFAFQKDKGELEINQVCDIYLDKIENHNGECVLSRSRARSSEIWEELEKSFEAGELVTGYLLSKTRGGLTVDVGGLQCFLPGSQLDVKILRDVSHLMDQPLTLKILKMDKKRSNIVVSRRVVLEESSKTEREEQFSKYKLGQVVTGKVKAITEYGAFVSLGSMDSLLHSSDIGWKRISHPSEVLKIDEVLELKIIKLDEIKKRVSVSLKEMSNNPWDEAKGKININDRVKCTVTNVTDYGVFAELNDFSIEGLVHKNELSFSHKINSKPHQNFARSQSIETSVLNIDWVERKLSLSIKALLDNPYTNFNKSNPINTICEVTIIQIKDSVMICSFAENDEIEGILNTRDLAWQADPKEEAQKYKVGDTLKVVIVANENDRVSLSVREVDGNPFDELKDKKKGDVVTVTVIESGDFGLKVRVGENGPVSIIKRNEIAHRKEDARPSRYAFNDRLDAAITNIDLQNYKISLSVRMMEETIEREAMQKYGNPSSGSVLGDILGKALLGKDKKEN